MNENKGNMLFKCEDCGMVHFLSDIPIKDGKPKMKDIYLFFPCQRDSCESIYLFNWETQGVRKVSREYYLEALKMNISK